MISPVLTKRSSLTSDQKSRIMDEVRKQFPKENSTIQGIFSIAWELLYNQPNRDCCIVVVIRNGGYELGIADQDRQGFTPTPAYLKGKTYQETQEIASWFNTNVLLLSEMESLLIDVSSHRYQPA